MVIAKTTEEVANAFGRAVIRKKWGDILPLLAAGLKEHTTAESIAEEFGWLRLRERLRQMHIQLTGETDEMVPDLDPPKRFEVFEVEERDPPVGHDPSVPVTWMEVDFQPSEDSEFDACYNCFLAFVDEGVPRIMAFVIESATD